MGAPKIGTRRVEAARRTAAIDRLRQLETKLGRKLERIPVWRQPGGRRGLTQRKEEDRRTEGGGAGVHIKKAGEQQLGTSSNTGEGWGEGVLRK